MTLTLDRTTWARVRFGDVVSNVNEMIRDPLSAGIDRVIAMEHLEPGELKITRWGNPEDGTTFTRRVRPGQTLFGKRRAYQRKAAYAEFDAICSGDILTFRADPTRLVPELLPFLVQSDGFYEHALGTSAGSLSPRTNWKDLANYEFDLPPLDEQHRIADLLWALEAHLSAIRDVEHGVGEVATHAFEVVTAGCAQTTLASWITRIEAGRSPLAHPEPVSGEELGVLKVSAVGNGEFREAENKRLADAQEFRADMQVKAGDLLVTRANASVDNVARPCIVDADYPHLMLSDKTLRLVPRPGYPARVVLAALQSRQYRAHVHQSVGGTEAKNISQKRILTGPVPSLTPTAVHDLSSRLAQVEGVSVAVQDEAKDLNEIRTLLSNRIFGG